MEKEIFKPKLRITLLSENGCPVSDRLVDAYTELNTGPKVQHKGPIRVEVTLENKQDIENFKRYLDGLSGTLPIKENVGRGRPTSSVVKELESPREDILSDVEKMISEGKSQGEIVTYLRSIGFVFILTEEFKFHFPEFEFNKKDVGEPNDNGQYLNSYSWMVRQIKRAKDPKADKFDPQIIFGFSIINGPNKKVVPYLYKERRKPLKVAKTSSNTLSFSKVGFTKYPAFMIESERLKFSTEIRQLLNNPEKKPTKFFIRWFKDVKFPDTIKDKMNEIYNNSRNG